jgi:hypothetical protein
MAVQNSARSYLGIAKETTEGTPVAPTAYIPVSVSKLKPQDIIDPLLVSDLAQGSLVKDYQYIPGRTRSTVDFGGPVFADTIVWPIAALMGSIATTGASAPYTHTVSLKNASATAADAQPTSVTLTDFYAANVRAYPGISIHDFTLNFSSTGLLEYDAKGTGWISSTASTPTPTFTTITATPVWQATVSIGGTTISNAVEGSLTLARAANAIYGLANTQNPYSVFLGALSTTGKFKFVMEADTELTRFLTNTQPAIVLNWANGSGASATQIQATITKGAYTVAVIDRSKDYVEIDIDLTAIANTTDAGSTLGYSNIKWVFQNAVASGSYI